MCTGRISGLVCKRFFFFSALKGMAFLRGFEFLGTSNSKGCIYSNQGTRRLLVCIRTVWPTG